LNFKEYLKERITEKQRFSKDWPFNSGETSELLRAAYERRVQVSHREYKELPFGMLESVANWICNGKSVGLLLCGGMGNGKTTLAKSMVDVLGAQLKLFPMFRTERDIAREKDNFEYIKDLSKTKFLVLDDMGTEGVSNSYGNVYSPTIDILTKRYELFLPTICTTNLNIEDIGKRYGERLEDRIKEMFSVIVFENESYR